MKSERLATHNFTQPARPKPAWMLGGLAILLGILAIVLALLFPASNEEPGRPPVWIQMLFVMPALLAFPAVGALVAMRRAQNPVGWLFIVFGLTANLAFLSDTLVPYLLGLHLDRWASIVFSLGSLGFPVGVSAALLAVLYFPNGSLLSYRWRAVVWSALTGTVLNAISVLFMPGPLAAGFENPLGIPGAAALMNSLNNVSSIILIGAMLLTGLSMVIRLWRSQGIERQQLKWVMAASILMFTGFLGALLMPTLGLQGFAWAVGFLGLGMIPISAGIAILRYRLWDIDLLIRRTLIYSLITAALALLYYGSVALIQGLFRLPGEGRSQLPIVGSTMVIAALFSPLRRRMQELIDRRFYRRKYNAEKILAAFSAAARDEVDIEQLTSQLQSIVQETMQPEYVSLWLNQKSLKTGAAVTNSVTNAGRSPGKIRT